MSPFPRGEMTYPQEVADLGIEPHSNNPQTRAFSMPVGRTGDAWAGEKGLGLDFERIGGFFHLAYLPLSLSGSQ